MRLYISEVFKGYFFQFMDYKIDIHPLRKV